MAVLRQSRFQQAEQFFTTFAVNSETGHELAQILKPEYWANVAAFVKPLDKIVVRAEDGSFYAELLVMAQGDTWLKVEPLIIKEFAAKESPEVPVYGSGFTVKWRGPQVKWSVLRDSDKAVIYENLPSRDAAEREAKDYARTIAHKPQAA